DFAVPGRPAVEGGRGAIGDELLEDGMGVDATEAEGVDAGPSWRRQTVNPGPRLAVDVKRGLVQAEFRIGRLAIKRRRQDLVVQRQRRLDKSRDASRRHKVADHRFDRAEGAEWRSTAARAENARERLGF